MGGPDQIIFMIICFPLFMVAIMMHEVAHGYVAFLQGDPTAKYAGRLTLNPIDHLDPVGTLCFVISAFMGVGFGWAKPVPINPVLFKNYRSGVIKVSLAGVGANLLLIVITAILFKILTLAGVFSLHSGTPLSSYIANILVWFMSFNMILVVFNLIPIPPLDGSKVLMMILPREQAVALARLEPYGMFIIFGLLFFGVLGWLFALAQKILFIVLLALGIF